MNKMNNKLIETAAFKRLQEYRVDFAYSKKLFFAAADRVSRGATKYERKRKALEITAMVIDVLTLSSIAVYFSKQYENYSIIVIGLLSLISIGINLSLLLQQKKLSYAEYVSTANAYMDLHKQAKNMEARVNDGMVTLEELTKSIDRLHNGQIRLLNSELITEAHDHEMAKKAIEEGQETYLKDEFQKT